MHSWRLTAGAVVVSACFALVAAAARVCAFAACCFVCEPATLVSTVDIRLLMYYYGAVLMYHNSAVLMCYYVCIQLPAFLVKLSTYSC